MRYFTLAPSAPGAAAARDTPPPRRFHDVTLFDTLAAAALLRC